MEEPKFCERSCAIYNNLREDYNDLLTENNDLRKLISLREFVPFIETDELDQLRQEMVARILKISESENTKVLRSVCEFLQGISQSF